MAGINLKQLQKQLQSAPVYTPMTDEQINQQAQNKYTSIYDQNRTSAQQAYDTTALALQQQRDQLAVNYGVQQEAAKKATAQTLSNADRYSLQRGMQRSSYNNATLANIGLQGNKTLNALQQGLTTAQGDIDEKSTLLAQQLAQQLAAFDTQQQSDIQAYIDQLRQQEYERTTAAKQYQDELAMRLYQFTQAAKKGSGGSSRSSGSYTPAAAPPPQPGVNSFEEAYKNAVRSTPNSYSTKKGATTITKQDLINRRGF